jgi:hypothetical protein
LGELDNIASEAAHDIDKELAILALGDKVAIVEGAVLLLP